MRAHNPYSDKRPCQICGGLHGVFRPAGDDFDRLARRIQQHDTIQPLEIPTLDQFKLAPDHTHYVRLAEKINEIIEVLSRKEASE